MIRKIFALVFLTVIVFISSFAKPLTVEKVNDFTLKDVNGKEHSLTDFKDSKAIVVMFIATECPVSNAYNSRMAKLYDEFKGKGVTFIGINSNKQENTEAIKIHAQENKLNFLILKDPGNTIADKFGASVTPEVYVLNSSLDILYKGRIDDSRREEEVKSNDLKNTLNEVLNNKPISTSSTKAFGCTIKRVSS